MKRKRRKEMTVKPTVAKFLPISKDLDGNKYGAMLTEEGSYTNNHWLLRKDFVPKVLKTRNEKIGGFKKVTVSEAGKWPEASEKAEYVFSFDYFQKKPRLVVAVFKGASGRYVAFDEKYIVFLKKYIKDFSLRLGVSEFGPMPAVILSGERKAGLIMPVIVKELEER